MHNAHPAWGLVDARKEAFEALSDRIWGMPEPGFQERRASAEPVALPAAESWSPPSRQTVAPALDMALGR